ncbi:MAG: hypothetical protein P0111_00105 [Nitrospira sp.]|nr:hypothetical protein [Nitrospira sp.]
MRTGRYQHTALLVSALLVVFVSGMILGAAPAWVPPQWVDKVTMEVMIQKNMAKKGNFDPYLKQLDVISEAAVKGDYAGKRKGLNRFLEMLETKEGGISTDAAHQIFATVVKSVPYAVLLPLKTEDKLDPEEKALVDRMKRFSEAIKQQDERAALSF